MQRNVTRAERSLGRFGYVLGYLVMLWVWIGVNTLVFLVLTAVASVADFRMLTRRRDGADALMRYFINGGRTFLRLLRDGRTPLLARATLALGLLYWLIPTDLLAESFFPFSEEGPTILFFIDDVLTAFVVSKLFMYLCPDSLVAEHAAAVEEQARAHVAA